MHQSFPYLLFFILSSAFLMFLILFQNISSSCELHDNTESRGGLIIEGFFVADDVLLVIGSEDANFVESVLPFFLFHGSDFDLT